MGARPLTFQEPQATAIRSLAGQMEAGPKTPTICSILSCTFEAGLSPERDPSREGPGCVLPNLSWPSPLPRGWGTEGGLPVGPAADSPLPSQDQAPPSLVADPGHVGASLTLRPWGHMAVAMPTQSVGGHPVPRGSEGGWARPELPGCQTGRDTLGQALPRDHRSPALHWGLWSGSGCSQGGMSMQPGRELYHHCICTTSHTVLHS